MQCVRPSVVTILMLLMPLGVSALPDNVELGMLPPPPGPYLSSRQRLEPAQMPVRGDDRRPFDGNMPMPMRYMPSPHQLPYPPMWWGSQTGR